MNVIANQFELRTCSELQFSLNEVAWWQDRVAQGLISASHARGYIENEQRIINIKLAVLRSTQIFSV
jgi:hypothetical protein